jgi:hypothetical protein
VRLVPAVLDRWLMAGLLLLPVLGVLGAAALDAGDAGEITAAIVVLAAVVYAVVAWLAGLRRGLPAQLAELPAAPEEARLEGLGTTAARALAKAGALLIAVSVLAVVKLLVLGLAIAAGTGLVAAAAALHLARWESRNPGRLVREGAARPWGPTPRLQRF